MSVLPMSVLPRLAERLAAHETLFSAWVCIPDPLVAGTLARESFDAITFDMQHGAIDLAAALRGIGAVVAAGKSAVVRLPVEAFPVASQVLDAGASAVIAPMINSRAEAERFAAFTKFPPRGERSWGPMRALPLSGLDMQGYLTGANAFSLSLAMIETRAAFDAIDDILAVDNLDGIFVGPSDLSITLSGGAWVDSGHKDVDAAMIRAAARAKAAGKIAACFALTAERAAAYAKMGFSFITVSTDLGLLLGAAQQALKVARGD
jgi:4-hydroxy-2-oxoheptanedioate aldolase